MLSSMLDSKWVDFGHGDIVVSEASDGGLLPGELPVLVLGYQGIRVPSDLLIGSLSIRVFLSRLQTC
jgi:hypothetical protein